jgi:hypothetical protein
MRIDSSGRVGIGTTSPSAATHVVQPSAGSDTFRAENSASNNVIRLQAATSTDNYIDFYAGASSGSLILRGAGTELARINSSGRLLVGTSSEPNTGGTLCVNNGIGIVNNTTNRFATVEHGNGAAGDFTTITISATVTSANSSVIFETLMTGFSEVYLDNVTARYSAQAPVTMRNNASAGTSATLTVNGANTIYTLTITTSVTHPVVKVKVTAGGLAGDITLPTITFA